MTDYNIPEVEESHIDIASIIKIAKEYIAYIWERKWYIVACGVIGGLIGILYAVIKKPIYTASHKFSIESTSDVLSGAGGLMSLLGGGSSSGAFSGDNLIELLKSRTLVENTLLKPVCIDGDTMTLMEYKILADSLRTKCDERNKEDEDSTKISICDLFYPINIQRDELTRPQDSFLMDVANNMLLKDIVVEKIDKKLSYVNVNVSSTDEKFAYYFSKTLMEEVQDFYVGSKTQRFESNILKFQHRADSIRNEIDNAFYRAAKYRDQNLNPNLSIVNVEQLKIQTDLQINTGVYSEITKNVEMLKLNMSRETPIITIVDEPYYPLAVDKKGKTSSAIKFGVVFGFLACLFFAGKKYIESLNLSDSTDLAKTEE